jgi:hypothetical protein
MFVLNKCERNSYILFVFSVHTVHRMNVYCVDCVSVRWSICLIYKITYQISIKLIIGDINIIDTKYKSCLIMHHAMKVCGLVVVMLQFLTFNAK